MIELFNKYAKSFDLTVPAIMGKYHHSFRVMEYAKEIAVSLNLSEKDIELASNCGLLHDIARFKQYTEYQTYYDEKSFDHGDVGYDILNELLDDNEDKDIILVATKYHNKYALNELDDRTKLFCNIVRDADKLDIIKEQCNQMNDKEIIIKKELLDDIYNGRICSNKSINSNTDSILRQISWINDFNFRYSFKYIKDKGIIQNKFNLLSIYGETDDINKLKEFVFNKIEERIE